MSESYLRDIAYNYAEGTAAAWDRKMDQEDEDTLRDEAINPDVYKPEDGHEFTQSRWPSDLEREFVACELCGYSRTAHINQGP